MDEEPALMTEAELEELFSTPDGQNILTCIQCGICAATCPHGNYMEFPPRKLIAMMRAGLIDEVIRSDSLMKCVACYACMVKCPRDIKLTDLLLPLIKGKTMEYLPEMPPELKKSLENTLRYGNPMGYSPRKRTEWTKKTKVPVRTIQQTPGHVDVLWNVECYDSYYPRNIEVALATTRWLHRLGTDFVILGEEERCIGECANYFGEFGLLETLMEANVAKLQKYDFDKLLTSGAHAYNVLRLNYQKFGFTSPYEHTLTYVHARLPKVRQYLKKPLNLKITYHDSCCLGRQNGFYQEPRDLLSAIPGIEIIEMAHIKENSLCCGGGGGGMYLDMYFSEKGMERLSEKRVKEAVATGADVLAISCDFEISRFEDAVKVLGYDDKIVVRDIMELLDESAGGEDSI